MDEHENRTDAASGACAGEGPAMAACLLLSTRQEFVTSNSFYGPNVRVSSRLVTPRAREQAIS
jgi:hypothetical protein